MDDGNWGDDPTVTIGAWWCWCLIDVGERLMTAGSRLTGLIGLFPPR